MITAISIELAMRPSAGADGCPAGRENPLRPTGNRKQIDRLGDDQQRTASPSSTPRQRPKPNKDSSHKIPSSTNYWCRRHRSIQLSVGSSDQTPDLRNTDSGIKGVPRSRAGYLPAVRRIARSRPRPWRPWLYATTPHDGHPCGPSHNSTYLPPSPVSEIPRIRYRCKAIASAAVGIIEIADAAMMSCH
jgi:hypothetical protein